MHCHFLRKPSLCQELGRSVLGVWVKYATVAKKRQSYHKSRWMKPDNPFRLNLNNWGLGSGPPPSIPSLIFSFPPSGVLWLFGPMYPSFLYWCRECFFSFSCLLKEYTQAQMCCISFPTHFFCVPSTQKCSSLLLNLSFNIVLVLGMSIWLESDLDLLLHCVHFLLQQMQWLAIHTGVCAGTSRALPLTGRGWLPCTTLPAAILN